MHDGRRATEFRHLRRVHLAGGVAIAMLAVAPVPAIGEAALGGDPAYGEYLSGQCVTCHRAAGASDGSSPPIVGLPPAAFVDALLSYKSGERENQVMRNVTSALGLEEIAALAAYFAFLSPD